MYWFRTLPLLLCANNALAIEGYIIGGGFEGDSADGLSASMIGELGLTEKTWISAAVARNSTDLRFREDLKTWFADIGIDHWWDPVGLRAGVSYWGDKDSLESMDWRASLYWRNDTFSIAGDYEAREFTFDLSTVDTFPARRGGFDADGVGLTTRFDVTDSVSVGLSGMNYNYDVNLRLDSRRGLLELLSFSRLSLINSLVDYRAYATLGIDVGKRRWQFDVGTWKGEVDGSTTRTATVRFLNPLGDAGDVEFSLGIDDSELYGNVTFFSVFLYFYGGS
ncbi:MAG: hypothetical protein KJO95_01150 [Gammaproteobacteria bacterium]|nr:hypothetical protein [Gammaproteobacteria bacterium]MBU2677301.1 hypothetical protein [Gammaproteobacteria bacterium]NNC57858.1 hypothetical protein [Woeseiaceae bacterium]NNL51032.1 hypothetical protein [Woeseiaceae bacterium]